MPPSRAPCSIATRCFDIHFCTKCKNFKAPAHLEVFYSGVEDDRAHYLFELYDAFLLSHFPVQEGRMQTPQISIVICRVVLLA